MLTYTNESPLRMFFGSATLHSTIHTHTHTHTHISGMGMNRPMQPMPPGAGGGAGGGYQGYQVGATQMHPAQHPHYPPHMHGMGGMQSGMHPAQRPPMIRGGGGPGMMHGGGHQTYGHAHNPIAVQNYPQVHCTYIVRTHSCSCRYACRL